MAVASTSSRVTPLTQADPAILVADGLDMRFATPEGDVTALDNVSFDVAPANSWP